MKSLVLSALAVSAAAALLLPAERLVFEPEEGTVLSKLFEAEITFELDEVSVLVNGEDMGQQMAGIEGGVASFVLEVEDRFAGVAGGRATELVRSFERIGGSFENHASGEVEEMDESELEGSVVRFVWDADEETYVVTLEEGGAGDDQLDRLSAEMDYLVLLPPDPVGVGDRWTVSGGQVFSVLFPGLELDGIDAGDLGEKVPAEVVRALRDVVENAEITCVLRSVGEEGVITVADIALEGVLEGDLSLDPSSFLEAEEVDMSDMWFEAAFSIDFVGTLLWDVTHGHFHSLELSGDGPFTVESGFEIPDYDMDMEATAEFTIVLEERATATRR